MDPRLLSSARAPYFVNPGLPSEGRHLIQQERHLGAGLLPLRGPVPVAGAGAAAGGAPPGASYSALAAPGSLSSGQGYYTVESLVGASAAAAPPRPRVVSAEPSRLLGGVAVPPGYKLVPVGQQGHERAPAVQQGYERAPPVRRGRERASAVRQGFVRVPAVQQQGYQRAPAVQQQGFEAIPAEYSYPGVEPLANAGMGPPEARQVNRMAGNPRLREMYLPPPRLPRLRPQSERPPVLLIRRPAYRLVREGEYPIPTYGPTRGLGQAWDRSRPWEGRADLVRDRPPSFQMPRFERPRKKARLSKNEASAATARAVKLSPERGSVWCSVCQINCGTVHILKQHLAGKRHKKQLDKKKNDSQGTNKNSDNQVMNVNKGQESEGKSSLAAEGYILNGDHNQSVKNDEGKKPEASEKCEVCNVTCANRAVLQAHLVGKKHAARIRKLLSKDDAPKSNGKISAADGTSGNVKTADGNVNTGEEENTGIVSELLQETAKETETLVAVKEPCKEPTEKEENTEIVSELLQETT